MTDKKTRHASLWSPKNVVMSVAQSTMTGQAWPLDLCDITEASEHVSIGGWRLQGNVWGERREVWWGDSQPGPEAEVGDGWRRWRLWGTRRGQAVLVVIKEAPIKRCPGPWLHCQAVRERMHGGGDAEGHLIDKSRFFLSQKLPGMSVKQNVGHFSYNSHNLTYLR